MTPSLAPYWTSADGSIVVYHSRWEDVLAAGLLPVRDVALVHADPMYGVGERTDRGTRGRGREKGGAIRILKGAGKGGGAARDFPPVQGDDKPYDPVELLALKRPLVLWGANHYADKVPGSPSWIVWDKRRDVTPDDNADGELAWTNLGGPLRIFRHLWRGLCRDSERGGTPGTNRQLAPTQKPIALSSYVFNRAKLKRGDLVFVPYLGSGPDLPAAVAMGLRVIACDVERWCCDTAIGRLGAITAERAAEPVGPLFAGAP